MSRHRSLPPGGRFPGPRAEPGKRSSTLQLTLKVLLFEVTFGTLLWGSVPSRASVVLLAYVLGIGAIILWTRRFGLLRPRGWPMAVREGLLLYVGVICFANFVWLCFGDAPWWR